MGRYNFDTIRYDYYRDDTVALEAFKGGAYDFRQEPLVEELGDRAYDVPAVRDGRIRKEQIPNEVPTGMQGFVFNTRRAIFRDPRVREALAAAFDFEWSNAHLFYGAYARTAQLLLQLRAGLARTAGRGRAGGAGAVPRPRPRRGVHARVPATLDGAGRDPAQPRPSRWRC